MPQYNSYYLYQKMVKYDGQDWIPSYPAAYSEDGVDTMPLVKKMDNDPECGYVPVVTPIYRWVDVTYNPSDSSTYVCDVCPHDYSTDYLTFVAQESGSFSFSSTSGNSIQYSLDSGLTWSTASSAVTTPTINSGSTVLWKGIKPSLSGRTGTFSSTGQFEVEGNVMSLVYGDNFSGQTDLTTYEIVFGNLFVNCSGLTNAENMVLPATLLEVYCYFGMFAFCTSLTTAPSLPATTLASRCYESMFLNCTSLTTAPSLSATTLAEHCYAQMFEGCTSLTTAPSLPATTLQSCCYMWMFKGCTSLTTAPSLPATTLADSCYDNMFEGCTSLTTAPQLPATTLTDFCYNYMFEGCTSLTTAPELSATTLVVYCYAHMFEGCTNLNSITCLATDISATDCTNNWLSGVSASGTFTRDCNTNWSSGSSGIPNGWQDNCPKPFSAQYLTFVAEENCTFSFTDYNIYLNYSTDGGETWTQGYEVSVNSGQKVLWKSVMSWFSGSKVGTFSSTGRFHVEGNVMSLVYGDELNEATSLSGRTNIFTSLFNGCTTLTSAENMVLPATTLSQSCYGYMFAGCTSLTTAPELLPATTLSQSCYYQMFSGCTSLTTAPTLPATTLANYCYFSMFRYCSSLSAITCLATDISATICTSDWLYGVAANGTFTKAASMSSWTTGNSGIPSGWTVQDYS